MSVTFPGHLPGDLTGQLTGLTGRLGGFTTQTPPARPVRRVRHEVKDGVAVVAFSAAASSALALALMLLVHLAG
jgi:hypothetical protein